MDCNSLRALLMDHLYGELDSPQREEFLVHLEECELCRKRVEEMERGLREYRDEPRPKPPAGAAARALAQAKEAGIEKAPRRTPAIPLDTWKRRLTHPALASAAVLMIAAAILLKTRESDDDYRRRVIENLPAPSLQTTSDSSPTRQPQTGLAMPETDGSEPDGYAPQKPGKPAMLSAAPTPAATESLSGDTPSVPAAEPRSSTEGGPELSDALTAAPQTAEVPRSLVKKATPQQPVLSTTATPSMRADESKDDAATVESLAPTRLQEPLAKAKKAVARKERRLMAEERIGRAADMEEKKEKLAEGEATEDGAEDAASPAPSAARTTLALRIIEQVQVNGALRPGARIAIFADGGYEWILNDYSGDHLRQEVYSGELPKALLERLRQSALSSLKFKNEHGTSTYRFRGEDANLIHPDGIDTLSDLLRARHLNGGKAPATAVPPAEG